MTAVEKSLLNNALDALDRIFDRQTSVIDLSDLLFATAAALRETQHYSAFEGPAAELVAIVRSRADEEAKRDRVLDVTDPLRHYLAELLPIE